MTDWDADSATVRANLHRVLSTIRDQALRRTEPTVEQAREWHGNILTGLSAPRAEYVGRFRGEPGLAGCEVAVGDYRGVAAEDVADALKRFEAKLQRTVEALDELIDPAQDLSADDVAAVIDLCAWAHAEWVRIHPFANGNGRTARLWANYIAMRYGLPPFVGLRPRPDDGYGYAAEKTMEGRWQPTAKVFREMFLEALRR